MKTLTPARELLFMACVAAAALADAAAPAPDELLDDVTIPVQRQRERQAPALRAPETTFFVDVTRRAGINSIKVSTVGYRNTEVSFRRGSEARRLVPESARFSLKPVRGDRPAGDSIGVGDGPYTAAILSLDDNVEAEDGLPASLPFGPRAALVDLDYVRLRDSRGQTLISTFNVLYPQTRRCLEKLAILDDDVDGPHRFILLHQSLTDCQRNARARDGDLLFADDVPRNLRQAVLEVYGPISVSVANRLGSEPGLVFVAWRDGAVQGLRFERSWDRSNLLLFNGAAWQQGLGPQQRESLRATFTAEQIRRRFRQVQGPNPLTESAARYLLALFTAEQAGNTGEWLRDALPRWITDCATHLDEQRSSTTAGDPASLQCALLVQFVYDAVARARSAGRNSLYDTWKRLLDAAFRRDKEDVASGDFLASSAEARRIVQGLVDGRPDWNRFATDLDGVGVSLRIDPDAPGLRATVLALTHFPD